MKALTASAIILTAAVVSFPAIWWAYDVWQDRRTAGFLEQLTAFPNAKNDDMVDAMSQAAAWLTARVQNTAAMFNAFTGEEIPWKTY